MPHALTRTPKMKTEIQLELSLQQLNSCCHYADGVYYTFPEAFIAVVVKERNDLNCELYFYAGYPDQSPECV